VRPGPGTQYHFRLCAKDAQEGVEPGCSADRVLRTSGVPCGTTITKHTKLESDVVCVSPGPALSIGADKVTLDLDGHTIGRWDIYSPEGEDLYIDGRDHVGTVIKNGKQQQRRPGHRSRPRRDRPRREHR
jgi:hypothetical protein